MNRGFYIILIAQFLSALADNALLFTAIALLTQLKAPDWYTPILQSVFVVSFVALAPFVGSFADSLPKGRVMFISNGIKFAGSFSMLLGVPPLYAYAVVGTGAAFYSPAKYGILTEYLPHDQLVAANGWMEGTTVAAIILGALIGSMFGSPYLGNVVSEHFGYALTSPYLGMMFTTGLYLAAAGFNYYIPRLPPNHAMEKKTLPYLLHDFWKAFIALWRDPQGRISLAVTTLFWGAGATMRLVVLAWAAVALNFGLDKATKLTAMVAIGIAFGAVFAAKYIKLQESVKVLPAGILMGVLVAGLVLISNVYVAAVVLFLVGVLAGYFVVPLNALLQHRGHILIGPGHSIAVQNFNENIGILVMSNVYTWMVHAEMSIMSIVVIFGAFVSLSMSLIYRMYLNQQQ
ncbi:MAG: lysophospholipid transporter LplT [Methylobacillus sp.]|jgi:MFS family permease|nr:lysophospholipid transporter LplT [Methylobacillus sp.]